MKKIYLFLALICTGFITNGQTTVTIYAGGGLPLTDSITGYASAITGTRYKDSMSADAEERAYAVFNLGSIPTSATITSVVIGYNISAYTVVYRPASAWKIYGYAGDLSLVTSEATLYADCIAGTSLYTAEWDSSGNQTQPTNASAQTFIQGHLGASSKVSMCFSCAGYIRYGFTGEDGSATTSGTHAPFLQVTYMPCPAITPGPTDTLCPGSTLILSDSLGGGSWTSSLTSVATIDDSTGVATGISTGITTISYVNGGCTSTVELVVIGPTAISPSGAVTVCTDQTTTLTDGVSGGVWTSSNAAIATVSSGGVVSGLTPGAVTITYTLGGCYVIKNVTVVGPVPISPATSSICVGGTVTVTDASGSGGWTSSNPSVASVSSGGVVTGVSAGSALIYYTVGSCFVSATVNVTAGTSPIEPPGPVTVCIGSPTTLTDTSAGGTWSSSSGVATVGSSTGVVTGVSTGIATITYTVGTCFSTEVITVSAGPAAISPTSATVCTGSTVTLTDATGGGAWTSSSGAATVSGGIVTGVSAGTATISYTVGACSSTALVTIVSGPATITPSGAASVCTGTTITLVDATVGGVWTSSSSGIASVSGGIVTGISAGTAIITYSISGCYVTKSVTVTSGAAAISPTSATICAGGNFTFTDGTSGGAWTSGNSAVATVAAGFVTGVGAGTTLISYTVGTCSATASITVNATPVAITPSGAVSICSGTTSTLTDATGGGAWTSSNAAIATVSGGIVTGISAGTVTISYAIGTCFVTKLVTITSGVSPIVPSSATICTGSTFTFTDATSGGVWTTGAPAIVTVAGGVAIGVSSGTALISYTVGTCSATASVTVDNGPAAVLPATSIICQGTSETLTDASGGGAWSSGSAGIASVTAGGVVTGVGTGVVTISYSVGSCSSTAIVTVSAAPTAIAPSSATVCVGSSISLIESVGGGTWTSSAPGISTVSVSGLVTGVALGNDTITYSIGTCSTTATITVNPLAVAGTISGPTSICGTGSITLTDPAVGGTWTASNGNATVSAGGVVTGVTAGTDVISYSVSNGCGTVSATQSITVDGAPDAGTIYGPATICAGSFTILADSSLGGTWSVTNGNAAITGTGILTGLTIGVDTVLYTVINACGGTATTKIMNILPLPDTGVISGPNAVCVLSTVTLSETVAGGTWSSSNSNATVSATGVVTGVTGGSDNILYSVTNGCGTFSTTWPITVDALPDAGTITGLSSVCAGSNITLIDPSLGGSFSSSNSNATVIPSSGIVSGVTPGVDTITYTVINLCGLATTTKSITVDPMPIPAGITGPGNVCLGATITMTDATAGGTWSSTNSTATVSGTGVVTGVSAGTDTILYTIVNSCGTGFSSAIIDVNTSPSAGSILGGPDVCVGSSITVTDAVAGGTWSASNGDATISASGIILGVAAGTDIISYTVVTSCGTAFTIIPISVDAYPTAGVISGPDVVCTGGTISLTESLTGGTWSSGSALATITTSGVVTGVTSGTDTISYTIVNTCSTVGTFEIITIMPLPDPGTITGPTSVCLGSNITLVDVTAGGTWSSSSTNATVTGGGVVTGVSAGIAPISYSMTNSCGTVAAVSNVSVVTFPVTGAITGPSVVCEGATITVTNVDTGGVWITSNGNATITSGGVISGVTAGIDSVFYQITNACGSAETNSIITVNATPVVSGITGATSVCVGSNTTLNDGTSGGNWSSSNNSVGAIVAGTGQLTGVAAGIDTVSYTVSNVSGCSGIATWTDTVFAVPVSTPITGTMTICSGSTTTLANSIPTGIWSSSNTTVATIDPSTGVVTGVSAGTTSISYDVTNMCGSASDGATVTVLAIPVVSPISGVSTTVCAGTTTQVIDATAGGTWSSSDTTIATVGSTTGVVTGTNAGTVTITYTVSNGSGCAGFATFNITFGSSIGTSYVTPSTGTICTGHTLTMQVITAGSGISYQWLRNGSDILGATGNGYVADSPGSYSVIISNGSCQETLTGTTVTLLSVPTVTFTSPNVLSTGAYGSYQWYRNNVAIPGATDATYSEHAAGTYKVVVTDGSGCSDTSTGYVITGGGGGGGGGGTAVANVNNNSEISFYPNPASLMLHINAPSVVNVKILSPDGRVVMVQNEAVDINVSVLSSGVYIIMVYDNDNLLLKTGKFMKL